MNNSFALLIQWHNSPLLWGNSGQLEQQDTCSYWMQFSSNQINKLTSCDDTDPEDYIENRQNIHTSVHA